MRRRRRPGVYEADAHGCTKAIQPNHVWTVDFKGWFTLGNGQRCDPLTVRDHYSHYVLCTDGPSEGGGLLHRYIADFGDWLNPR